MADHRKNTLKFSIPQEEFEQFIISQILELKIATHVNTYLLSRMLERVEQLTEAEMTAELELIQRAIMENMEMNLASYTVMPENLRRIIEQALRRPGSGDDGQEMEPPSS